MVSFELLLWSFAVGINELAVLTGVWSSEAWNRSALRRHEFGHFAGRDVRPRQAELIVDRQNAFLIPADVPFLG